MGFTLNISLADVALQGLINALYLQKWGMQTTIHGNKIKIIKESVSAKIHNQVHLSLSFLCKFYNHRLRNR